VTVTAEETPKGARPQPARRRRGHGEGHIHQRADGRWEARIDLGYAGGKRRRKSLYGDTRREVLQKLEQAKADLREGLDLPPARLTVETFLGQWLAEARSARGARTVERYATLVRLHILPRIGHIRLAQLRPQHVQRLQDELLAAGLAPRTVIKVRDVLSVACRRAERWRIIPRNPVPLVDPPRVRESEERALSREEAQRFIEAIRGDRLEALYLVALALGVRRGEALGLRWADVDWKSGTLTVERQLQRVEHGGGRQLLDAKTRAGRRVIVLPEVAVRKLEEHRQRQDLERQEAGARWQETGHVFTSTVGTPIEPRNVNRAFDVLRSSLGLQELKLHGLRHSATSLYLALGVPPHVVQRIVGRADPRTTMRVYAHATDDDRRRAAELMDEALRTA
jgi:integrase